MKRLLILLFALSACLSSLASLTVNNIHYGFADACIRNYKQGAWNESSTDLSEGTGKAWSFTLPTTGYVNNTYHSVSGLPGFPTANIRCVYSQYVNDYYYDSEIYYHDDGEDIFTLGYPGTPLTVWDPPMPAGLPHFLGKTWQGTHTYTYGGHSIDAKVISEGVVSTHLGTFPALCVRYSYTSQYLTYSCYQWETAEYGIIAYTTDVNGGMLYVLHEANPWVAISDNTVPSVIPSLSVYPNPAKDYISIVLNGAKAGQTRIELYNLRGQRLYVSDLNVHKDGIVATSLDIADIAKTSGIYLLRLSNSGAVFTSRVVVNK